MTAQLSAAADLAGIGLTLLPVLYSYAGFGGQPAQAGQVRFIQDADTYLRQQAIIRQQITGKVLQNQGLCFHSLRAVTPTQMQQVYRPATALPVHIHIAEQQKEVNDCLSWSGQRPIAWLYDHLDIDARWCLVHATHADEKEVARMAQSGAVAGLCPTTKRIWATVFSPASIIWHSAVTGVLVPTAMFHLMWWKSCAGSNMGSAYVISAATA
jgi:formimidoylglutamate deiminase